MSNPILLRSMPIYAYDITHLAVPLRFLDCILYLSREKLIRDNSINNDNPVEEPPKPSSVVTLPE
jgi:hypothetical protein